MCSISTEELVRRVRETARGQDVLYHGTRYPRRIVGSGKLYFAPFGHPVVCFTRSPVEAVYWATLCRDDDDGQGAVFVLDRRYLRARRRIEPYHDPIWDTDSWINDEMEERIWRRDVDLAPCLLGIVFTPREDVSLTHRQEAFLTFSRLTAHRRSTRRTTCQKC
jgi:hypothetical protein